MHNTNVVKNTGRIFCNLVLIVLTGLLLPGCKTTRVGPLSNSEPIVVKNGPVDLGFYRKTKLKRLFSGTAVKPGGEESCFTIYREDDTLSVVTVRAYFAEIAAIGGGQVGIQNISDSLDSSWFDGGGTFVGSGTYAFSGTTLYKTLSFTLNEPNFTESGPGNTLLIFLVTGSTAAQQGGVIYSVAP